VSDKPDPVQPDETALLKELPEFVSDGHFWIAVILGPAVWLGLWILSGMPAVPGMALSVFLGSVILYPVIEELAFRGFIQSWLLEKPVWTRMVLFKISRANVLTSFMFAALHLFNQPPLWAALIFLPSLVFGYLRERFDAVTPCILIHCWYNLGFLWLFS